jgi:hypothetical protein
MKLDREKTTRDLAYKLWDKAGRPWGRADEFWLEAERKLFASDSEESEWAKKKVEEAIDNVFGFVGKLISTVRKPAA